jgi:hypothetical protein
VLDEAEYRMDMEETVGDGDIFHILHNLREEVELCQSNISHTRRMGEG